MKPRWPASYIWEGAGLMPAAGSIFAWSANIWSEYGCCDTMALVGQGMLVWVYDYACDCWVLLFFFVLMIETTYIILILLVTYFSLDMAFQILCQINGVLGGNITIHRSPKITGTVDWYGVTWGIYATFTSWFFCAAPLAQVRPPVIH